jgi:hypothetical protein
MALGIRQMVALGGSLVFAIPLAMYGLEQLAAGEPMLAGGALVIAALMVALPQYLTTPGDLPGKAADKALGRIVPEESGANNPDADSEE